MPENIISQWLNLSSVEVVSSAIQGNEAHIFLSRDTSAGFRCSGCGRVFERASLWKKRKIRDLSVFEFKSYLVLHKYRVSCPRCGFKVESIDFIEPFSRCTKRFEDLVARLCQITSVKQVAELLELDWKTVKEIDKKHLERQFAIPDYEGLSRIAIDEVASHKGHSYFTVVLDLQRTRVIWVGKDRSEETLDAFFKELGPERCKKLEAIAIDMWDPYLASIRKYAPQIKEVFDKFHVLNSYSRVIDKVRNIEYKRASKEEKEVIKGSKYLLLKNKENLKSTERRNEKRDLRQLLRLKPEHQPRLYP